MLNKADAKAFSAAKAAAKLPEYVVYLDKYTFNETVAKYKFLMVMFSAPFTAGLNLCLSGPPKMIPAKNRTNRILLRYVVCIIYGQNYLW